VHARHAFGRPRRPRQGRAGTPEAHCRDPVRGAGFDYNLLIISDACTSPEQDNHAQFMTRIFPRMARVRTITEVLRMPDISV
jgi:hypothetical protein